MIDINKKYRTRDGHAVKIFMVKAAIAPPVLGAIEVTPGQWSAAAWYETGTHPIRRQYDLVLIPEEVNHGTWWIPVFKFEPMNKSWVRMFITKESCEQHYAKDDAFVGAVSVEVKTMLWRSPR